MTFAFAAFTVGAIFIFTAFKDLTVGDFLRGTPSNDSETTDSFLPSGVQSRLASYTTSGSSSGGGGGTASSNANVPKGPGLKRWPNGNVVIAAWIYTYLKKIGFTGSISSGYRTPAYSESLCMDMCGAPSCPGTCAGRSSNHSGKTFPAGAIDVPDYGTLQAKIDAAARRGIPRLLKNDLPADRGHYSNSGH